MELYQLRGFAAVAKTGHITRAARKLHLTQPTVSGQIRALEEEFGLTLFERTRDGMSLTPAGARILVEAEKVLCAAQATRDLAKTLRNEVLGKVRLGTSSDPLFIRVGEFLSAQIRKHPMLQVELQQTVTGAAFSKVLDGELDAAFYYGDVRHPAMGGLPLRTSIYRVAAAAAWASRLRGASWNQLAPLPWIIAPSISSHYKLVHGLFAKYGTSPAEVVEANQESLIVTLVCAGIGLSLVREDLALEKQASGEMCLWGEEGLESRLWFIYPLAREADPVIRALLDVLREIWNIGAEQKIEPRGAKSGAAALRRS